MLTTVVSFTDYVTNQSLNGTWQQTKQNGVDDVTLPVAQVNTIQAAYDLAIVYMTIGTFGFLSNMYVVSVIATYRPMHKQWTNIYIVNQSVIDATVALFLFLTTLYQDNQQRRTRGYLPDEALCRIWYTKLPLWGMLTSSTYGIVALSFERFLAVVFPIWHKTKFNKSLLIGTLVTTWVVGPAYQFMFMVATAEITPSGECTVYTVYPNALTKSAVGVLTIFVQFIFPLSLLAIFYGRMAFVLHRRVEPEPSAGKEAKRNESMARARSNVIKTLALVAFFFIICWSLNQIYYLLFNLGIGLSFTSVFYNFTVIMVFMNCCVNPVVYSLKYEQFQRGVASIFCRNRVRASEETAATSASG